MKISLGGLALTAVFQLVIVLVSGSVPLLADTVHNFSEALTAVPLWVAFLFGRRAAIRTYTYGFGRDTRVRSRRLWGRTGSLGRAVRLSVVLHQDAAAAAALTVNCAVRTESSCWKSRWRR